MIDSNELSGLKRMISERLGTLIDCTIPQANTNRMKCFHQGQADAFEEVLEMIEEMEELD